MNKTNIISGSIFTIMAAAFMIGAYGYGIGYSTSDNVAQAGFFPFYLAMVVLILGLVLIFQGVTHRGPQDASFVMDDEIRKNLRTFFLTLGALVFCFALWHIPTPAFFLDYYLTSFEPACLILCLILNILYKRSWLFNILFSTFIVLLIHLLFVRLLSISFDI